MVWPMLATAAFSAFSAHQQNRANKQLNTRQLDFNANQATSARDFSERQATVAYNRSMDASNTAHQRQIVDLRKAGLNPILSARYGGSSTPPVASPSASPASAGALRGAVNVGAQAVQSALDTAKISAAAQLATAQSKKVDADTTLSHLDAESRRDLNMSTVAKNRMLAKLHMEQGITERFGKQPQIKALIANIKSQTAGNYANTVWRNVSTDILRAELVRARAFARVWRKNPTVAEGMAFLQEGVKAGLSIPQIMSALSKVLPSKLVRKLGSAIPSTKGFTHGR